MSAERNRDPADAIRVVTELIETFNAADWPRFRATLDPAVTNRETGTGRHTEGADAYVTLVQGWKAVFPDVRGRIHHAVAGGDTVAVEVTWEGTHLGPLPTPAGPVPPSGRRIANEATMWFAVRGGRVHDIRHHLDMLTLLQQTGALPAAPPT
jgi:predicted ester cyclase